MFGKNDVENQKDTELYIVECETLADRLKKHNKEKDSKEVAIAFIFSSQRWQLNKADIKYLEHTSYVKAKLANRFYLNQTILTKSLVTELNELLDIIKVLLTALRYLVFAKLVTESDSSLNDVLFYTTAKESDAKGIYTNEGFVVLKGSKNSSRDKNARFNNRNYNKDYLRMAFLQKIIFSSPSTASSIIIK